MRPIFIEKFVEKCILWVRKQCTEALFMEDLVNNCGLEEKKKGKHRKKKRGRANRNPNTYKSFGSKLPQMSKGVKIGDQTAKTFPHQLIRTYPFNLP